MSDNKAARMGAGSDDEAAMRRYQHRHDPPKLEQFEIDDLDELFGPSQNGGSSMTSPAPQGAFWASNPTPATPPAPSMTNPFGGVSGTPPQAPQTPPTVGFGNSFNSIGAPSSTIGGFPQPGQPLSGTPPTQTPKDMVGEAASKAAVAAGKGVIGLVKASGNKEMDAYEWGLAATKGQNFGFAYLGIGTVMLILNFMTGWGAWFALFLTAGVTSIAVFLIVGLFSNKKLADNPDLEAELARRHGLDDSTPFQVGFEETSSIASNPGFSSLLDDNFEPSSFSDDDASSWEDEDDEEGAPISGNLLWDDEEDDELWDDEPEEDLGTPIIEMASPEEVLSSVKEMTPGMYTRQFLYEKLLSVLKPSTPNFSSWTEVPNGSTEFALNEDRLVQAALQIGVKEGEEPMLERLRYNNFMLQYTLTRPRSLTGKEQKLADELAEIYAHDENGDRTPGIFGKATFAGGTSYISVFTGPTAQSVSLRDSYQVPEVRDFILDTRNEMPVALGVSDRGEVLYTDFSKIDSIIISGLPRAGKSWAAHNIMGQLAAFFPPSEMQFIILDAKEGYSSYENLKHPHLQELVVGHQNILDKLRWIFEVEQPRRARMLQEAGVTKIQDYNKKNPHNKMPYLYVINDEMMALSENMSKEMRSQYHGYLAAMVSQLPALGIRVILIPHRVVNDVIPKNVSALVPAYIAVNADKRELENMPGFKASEFPYQLSGSGDSAIKVRGIKNSTVSYARVVGLMTSDEEQDQFYDFLGGMWEHLDTRWVPKETKQGTHQVNRDMASRTIEYTPQGRAYTTSGNAVGRESGRESENALYPETSSATDILAGVENDPDFDLFD